MQRFRIAEFDAHCFSRLILKGRLLSHICINGGLFSRRLLFSITDLLDRTGNWQLSWSFATILRACCCCIWCLILVPAFNTTTTTTTTPTLIMRCHVPHMYGQIRVPDSSAKLIFIPSMDSSTQARTGIVRHYNAVSIIRSDYAPDQF